MDSQRGMASSEPVPKAISPTVGGSSTDEMPKFSDFGRRTMMIHEKTVKFEADLERAHDRRQDALGNHRRSSVLDPNDIASAMQGLGQDGDGPGSTPATGRDRTLKLTRFRSDVNTIRVKIGETELRIPVNGGDQNIKWLASTARYLYVKRHPYLSYPEQFVATNVIEEKTGLTLMPLQAINERLEDRDQVKVVIKKKGGSSAGRPRVRKSSIREAESGSATGPSRNSSKTLWELCANTPTPEWQLVRLDPKFERGVFALPSSDDEDDGGDEMGASTGGGATDDDAEGDEDEEEEDMFLQKPDAYLHTNLNGFHGRQQVEVKGKTRKRLHIEVLLFVPREAEIEFYFEISGKKVLASNYPVDNRRIAGKPVGVNTHRVERVRARAGGSSGVAQNARVRVVDRKDAPQEIELVQNFDESELSDMSLVDLGEIQIADLGLEAKAKEKVDSIITDNYAMLRNTFQLLAGRTDPVEYMSIVDFIEFLAETKLYLHGMTKTLASVIFRRVNVMERAQGDSKLDGLSFSVVIDESNPRNYFVRSEWIESLVRVAEKWDIDIPVSDRFSRLVHAVKQRWSRPVSNMLSPRKTLANDAAARSVFRPYLLDIIELFNMLISVGDSCGLLNTVNDTSHLTTKMFEEFVHSYGLMNFGAGVDAAAVLKILAYSQGSSGADERGYKTNLAEFYEILARFAFVAFPDAGASYKAIEAFLQKLFRDKGGAA